MSIGVFPTEKEAARAVSRAETMLAQGKDADEVRLQLRPPKSTDRSHRSSRYEGVSWHKLNQKWMVAFQVRGAMSTLGAFDVEDEAGVAAAFAREQVKRRRTVSRIKQLLKDGEHLQSSSSSLFENVVV